MDPMKTSTIHYFSGFQVSGFWSELKILLKILAFGLMLKSLQKFMFWPDGPWENSFKNPRFCSDKPLKKSTFSLWRNSFKISLFLENLWKSSFKNIKVFKCSSYLHILILPEKNLQKMQVFLFRLTIWKKCKIFMFFNQTFNKRFGFGYPLYDWHLRKKKTSKMSSFLVNLIFRVFFYFYILGSLGVWQNSLKIDVFVPIDLPINFWNFFF